MTKTITLSQRLLHWYDQNGRHNLPWQQQPTPYRVWVSEIMLQQTQVNTVMGYYQRFMARFPDITALADAPLDEVLHSWSGLGYYARARNLHKTAQRIVDQHQGHFPKQLAALCALPGIGRSTAGAILALAMQQRHPILDGNVKRVLSRVHRVAGWPGEKNTEHKLWALAEQHTPQQRVAAYTQAIMDLGATICTRGTPSCGRCPLAKICQANQSGETTAFPNPKPRKALPTRSTTMLLLRNPQQQILLFKRPPAGIWGGLWSLPEYDGAEALASWCKRNLYCDLIEQQAWPTVKHSFTHFHLDITPVHGRIETYSGVMAADNAAWYNVAETTKLGLATPVKQLLARLTT